MKFTDKEALKIFKSIKCYELKESIESYPEDERDGKTDLIIIRDEIDYYAYMFEEGDGVFKGSLEESREILRKTNNGKKCRILLPSLKPEYQPYEIERAKRTVSEYRQIKRLQKKLKEA
jgi:hypothetical protein